MRGVKGTERDCTLCGKMFRSLHYVHAHCDGCRQPNGVMRRRQQAMERLWTDWLIRQLEPFLGSRPVSVNDLILYLREQASKERAA